MVLARVYPMAQEGPSKLSRSTPSRLTSWLRGMSGSEGPNKPRGVALPRSYPRRRWRSDAWPPSRFAPTTLASPRNQPKSRLLEYAQEFAFTTLTCARMPSFALPTAAKPTRQQQCDSAEVRATARHWQCRVLAVTKHKQGPPRSSRANRIADRRYKRGFGVMSE